MTSYETCLWIDILRRYIPSKSMSKTAEVVEIKYAAFMGQRITEFKIAIGYGLCPCTSQGLDPGIIYHPWKAFSRSVYICVYA